MTVPAPFTGEVSSPARRRASLPHPALLKRSFLTARFEAGSRRQEEVIAVAMTAATTKRAKIGRLGVFG